MYIYTQNCIKFRPLFSVANAFELIELCNQQKQKKVYKNIVKVLTIIILYIIIIM